ncbi:MAG: hypothetical protein HRT35_15580 [Algicola sp.]|nr:hypothetical protein [Algicola sp.]
MAAAGFLNRFPHGRMVVSILAVGALGSSTSLTDITAMVVSGAVDCVTGY